MRTRIRSAVIAVVALLPSVALAQGVVVQSTSELKFYGALNTVAGLATRLAGTDLREIRATTSVSGHKLRVETGDAATIVDADAGRFGQIDHKQKTYSWITFTEMAAAMDRAVQSGRQDMQKTKAEQAKDPKAAKGDVNFKYDVAVDRPGEQNKIAGYSAERVFLTITIEAEAKPEGEKAEQVGSLVFLFDQWRSKDAPQASALEDFQRAYAEKAGKAFRPPMAGLQAAFSFDPRIKDGLEASAKELQKVPGVALRSVMYVAVVPAGMTFDRRLVLNSANTPSADAKKDEAPKPGGFRGVMGAIKSAAEEASKKSNNKTGAREEPKQATLLSLVDEVKNITRAAVPPETFEAPAGYREIKQTIPSPE